MNIKDAMKKCWKVPLGGTCAHRAAEADIITVAIVGVVVVAEGGAYIPHIIVPAAPA